MLQCLVVKIDSVEPYGDNLSVIKVGDKQVIANRKEDGSFRWEAGELAVFIPENAILPEDVLKYRGYWDEDRNRGFLDGSKRNRVKLRRLGPDKLETEGLLFKVIIVENESYVTRFLNEPPPGLSKEVTIGDDLTEFFGITEFVPNPTSVL